jgi:long-chain acyl-CoA synthetase
MLRTLTDRLDEVVREAPEAVAILFREGDAVRQYTYGQVWEHCLGVAARLQAEGLKPGDRAAILLPNRPEWCFSYFGILLAGGVAVPLDLQYGPEQIRHILGETRARLIFASARAPLADLESLEYLEKIVVAGPLDPSRPKAVPFPALDPAAVADFALPARGPDDLASIIYTSGTTGPPKGVMLSQGNFYANYLSIWQLNAVTPQDNFLSLLPLHHALPFMANLVVPLLSRAKITYLDTLQAEAILQCLREQQVTILVVTPQVLQHFYQGIRRRLAALPLGLGSLLTTALQVAGELKPRLGVDLAAPLRRRLRAGLGRGFRYFICGGARLPQDLARGLLNLGFEVLEGYGLTETAPVVSINPPEAPRLGSVGRALAGVEVRIKDPDPEGMGEILIRGANVTPGYYLNDAATREAFRDGWFLSGDLGRLDQDGYLYVTGRLKDIIVLSSGKNVSTEEVGQHYLKSAKIKEIYVLPDAKEEKLVAVVVPDFEHFRATGEGDVYGEVKWQLEYYSQQLPPYMRLKDFVLVNHELPKTRLGKIKGYEAAALYRQQAGRRHQARRTALEEGLSPLGAQVIEVLAAKTGTERLYPDDHLELDLGLDSLALVELVAALEQELAVEIKEEEFAGIFTVAELIRFLEAKEPADAAGREEAEAPVLSWGELLKLDPDPALLAKIGLNSEFAGRLATLLLSLTLGMWFRLWFRLRVEGLEGLPPEGCIFCPNHLSFLDGFLVSAAVPPALRNRLFFMGFSNYFEIPVVKDLIKLIRVIPVNSARHLVEAMQASAYILRRGGSLCIFPEGARSPSGRLRAFKKGVAILARELGVKLVPVHISGSFEAWGPNMPVPRPHPIRVTFGRALTAAELREQGLKLQSEARDYEAITLALAAEVAKLGQRQAKERV